MWSYIELNDTLQITAKQGFPTKIFDLEKHQKNPVQLSDVAWKVFSWKDKKNARVYHVPPCRNFLVENRNGKWIYWGHIEILSQTMQYDEESWESYTSGTYKVIRVYTPEQQRSRGETETSLGKNYFK